jgi:hypothetical protein
VYELSIYALGSRETELIPTTGLTDQTYDRPTLLPPLELVHDGMYALLCSDRLLFRYTDLAAGPTIDTTRDRPANTVIVFRPCPQAPKKLHSVTVNVYDAPLCSNEYGIATGTALVRYTLLMNDCSAELFPFEEYTTMDRCAQLRPPLPLEPDRSIVGLVHLLNEFGNVMATEGTNTDDEADKAAVTVPVDATGQLEHAVATAEGHTAFRVFAAMRVTVLPGMMFPSPDT